MEKIIRTLEQKLKPKYENDVFTWKQIKDALTQDFPELVSIKVDGINYAVKPIITLRQIKRLIGGDNDHYKVEIINKPDKWEDKEIGEDELIDMNMPLVKNVEFKVRG